MWYPERYNKCDTGQPPPPALLPARTAYLLAQQNVTKLQAPVHYPLTMQVQESHTDLGGIEECHRLRHSSPAEAVMTERSPTVVGEAAKKWKRIVIN